MSLDYLKVQSLDNQDSNAVVGTTTEHQGYSGGFGTGNFPSNALLRVGYFRISVNTDMEYDPAYSEDESWNEGYFTICAANINISGYSGVEGNKWWGFNGSNYYVDTECPLYATGYQPMSPESPLFNIEAGLMFQKRYNMLGGVLPNYLEPPTTERMYRLYTEENTKLYGDQNALAAMAYAANPSSQWTNSYISTFNYNNPAFYGGNAVSDTGLAGTFFNPLAGDPTDAWQTFNYEANAWWANNKASNPEASWVQEGQDAHSLWHPNVLHVVAVDTLNPIATVPTADYPYSVRGAQGNIVHVWVVLKESSFLPNLTIGIFNKVDIDGKAHFYNTHDDRMADYTGLGSMPIFNIGLPINGKVEFTHSGEEDLTVEMKGNWTSEEKPFTHKEIHRGLTSSIEELSYGGYSVTEKNINRFSFSGKCSSNTPKAIARIKITASEGKYFSIKPFITPDVKNRDHVKLKLISIKKVKDSNGKLILPSEYVFDLIYKNNSVSTVMNETKVGLTYETSTITTRELLISKISFGKKSIRPSGEDRKIKISGTPGAEFALVVNESFEEKITQAGEVVSVFDKANDVSILSVTKRFDNNSPEFTNVVTDSGYGKNIKYLKGTIGQSGVYSFTQRFPSNVVHRNKITPAVSSSATIVFENSIKDANLRVGDRVYAKGLDVTKMVEIDSIPNPASDRLTLDQTVSMSNNTPIFARRKRCYNIDLIQSLSSPLASNMPTTEPLHRLYQHVDVKVTLRHSATAVTGGHTYAITHYNGVTTGPLSHSTLFDIDVMQNNYSSGLKKVVLRLDLTDASHAFTGVTKALYSNINQSKSNWENSTLNGGTNVKIHGFTFGTLGENYIDITYYYDVVKFGTKNVVLNLDFVNLISIST